MNNTTVPDNIMPDDMQNMQMANGVLSKKSPAPDSHTHKKKHILDMTWPTQLAMCFQRC